MIYQAVAACAKEKPVIASIVNVGGSGGYYIALGARTILADASAITGSIGVAGGKLATTGLMSKLGISTYEISRGRNAGLWTSRPWDEREQKLVKRMMEDVYRTFTDRVRRGRGKRVKDLDKVAQGRVFTARQAARNGLIDKVGGLRDAVAAAQKASKIKSSHIIVLPRPKTLADILAGDGMAASMARADSMTLRALLAEAPSALTAGRERLEGVTYLLTLGELLSTQCVLTAMPYHVSVKP
jgi:protease-4